MKKLPEYLNVNSPELAMAIAGFLKLQGWDTNTNINFSRARDNNLFANSKTICLRLYANNTPPSLVLYTENHFLDGGTHVNSWLEFYNLCFDPPEPPIRIGDYTVEFRTSGIQVGCTKVSWETIEKILVKRPK